MNCTIRRPSPFTYSKYGLCKCLVYTSRYKFICHLIHGFLPSCRMGIQKCRKQMKTRIGFLDPVMVTRITVVTATEQTEAYFLHSLVKMQSRNQIFLPYNFRYMLSYLLVLLLFYIYVMKYKLNDDIFVVFIGYS